jgi:(2R)-sulfolactate sulfo-lyase subunit beta
MVIPIFGQKTSLKIIEHSSNRYLKMIDPYKTDNHSGDQPIKSYITGSLTIIEGKALCNIHKIGKKCKYFGALDKSGTITGPVCGAMIFPAQPPKAVTLCT